MSDHADISVVDAILEATRTIARQPVEHFAMRPVVWQEMQAKLGVTLRDSHPMLGLPRLPTVYGVEIVLTPDAPEGMVEKHPGRAGECWVCKAREIVGSCVQPITPESDR